MDTVSSIEMFRALSSRKCITCFHKYIDTNDIINVVTDAEESKVKSKYFMLSTGISDNDFIRLTDTIDQLNKIILQLTLFVLMLLMDICLNLLNFVKKFEVPFPILP